LALREELGEGACNGPGDVSNGPGGVSNGARGWAVAAAGACGGCLQRSRRAAQSSLHRSAPPFASLRRACRASLSAVLFRCFVRDPAGTSRLSFASRVSLARSPSRAAARPRRPFPALLSLLRHKLLLHSNLSLLASLDILWASLITPCHHWSTTANSNGPRPVSGRQGQTERTAENRRGHCWCLQTFLLNLCEGSLSA
jgi:hypothetical protein